jgi:hypothetical protein
MIVSVDYLRKSLFFFQLILLDACEAKPDTWLAFFIQNRGFKPTHSWALNGRA